MDKSKDMPLITKELIDQLDEKYSKTRHYDTDEEFIKSIKDNFIGLHISEKEAFNFLKVAMRCI